MMHEDLSRLVLGPLASVDVSGPEQHNSERAMGYVSIDPLPL